MRSANFPILGINEKLWACGVRKNLLWDFSSNSHILVIGGTGSGKTYAIVALLSSIALHIPQSRLTICDYKAIDFTFLDGCENYYYFNNCFEGLKNFFECFEARQQRIDTSKDFRLLVFDEWVSFINNLDKQKADEAKKMLSTLLMLGRAFNVHVLICQQRADAKYFDSARDNFDIILAMGNLSKEGKNMFFSDYKDDISRDRKRGTGYIYIDGVGLKKILIPQIKDMNRAHQLICQVVY